GLQTEIETYLRAHHLPDGPHVHYVGRLVAAKGAEVLLDAWPRRRRTDATLVVVGDGPYAPRFASLAGSSVIGPLPREHLPTAYAAAHFVVVPSIPTPRFRE